MLFGKNLDEQVQQGYTLKLCEHGCAVNTTVVIAAASTVLKYVLSVNIFLNM